MPRIWDESSMKSNWLDGVCAYPLPYEKSEIRSLVKRRQLFALWLPGARSFIVPDFQIKGGFVSPWVAPLLGALVWIEDTTADRDRDRDGLVRGRWLYRRRHYLSESAVAQQGCWPTHVDSSSLESPETMDFLQTHQAITSLGLTTQPRSFAEVFARHPRFVIDYQYRLQGVRFDVFGEY